MKYLSLLCALAFFGCGGEPVSVGNPVACLIIWGQSNATGQVFIPPESAPAGVPAADIPYRPIVSQGTQAITGDTILPLDVTTGASTVYWGPEIQLGLDIRALGFDVAVGKFSRNGSSLASWLESGGANWVVFNNRLPPFRDSIARLYPGRTRQWFLLTNQGEFEAQDADSAGADNWATNLATLRTDLQALLGEPIQAPIVLLTNTNLAGGTAPNIAALRAQQAAADASAIDPDDIPYTTPHYDTPEAVATVGSRQAARVAAVLQDVAPMFPRIVTPPQQQESRRDRTFRR